MSDRYEKIREALAMGPTPGPWEVADGNSYLGIKANSAPIAALHVRVGVAKMHANAHHIAACDPDTIRALLAERDALRQALTKVLRVNETDAGNDVKAWANAMLNARAALAQGQGGSDASA